MRRSTEPRDGRVFRLATGGGATASATSDTRRASAASRLRSWDRCSDAVIVSTPPTRRRPSRSTLDFLMLARDLQADGVALAAVEDPVDLTTPVGKVVATVLVAFAEFEAAQTSARVKAARAHLLREGRIAGGERPWPFETLLGRTVYPASSGVRTLNARRRCGALSPVSSTAPRTPARSASSGTVGVWCPRGARCGTRPASGHSCGTRPSTAPPSFTVP